MRARSRRSRPAALWSGGVFDHFEESFNFVVNGSTYTGASYGGWSADFDQDGEDDVYLGNDPNTAQDRLLRGLGSGSFLDITATNLPAAIDYTVDVCGADLNGDGNLDLLLSTSHNWDENKIYYNNLGLGGDPGNFTYPGSVQFLGNPSANLNAMEAGDFDRDGDQDIYWSDGAGATTDLVLRNDGNDASGKATFTALTALPASVTAVTSRKATVADLNGDGRPDILVMKESTVSSRPTILRNVTVSNAIEFADWTPAPVFPTGNVHKGWHAAVFDSNGDGDLDIFLGGWSGDHLFEQEPGAEYNEGDLSDGAIPGVFNGDPAAVVGSAGPSMPDAYTINALTGSAFLSVVLNGGDDYLVEILDGAGAVLATVDRGGLGVEEAITFDPVTMPAMATLRVTALACACPNISGDCGVGISDFLDLLGAWGPNPGHPADLDGDGNVGVTDLWLVLGAWGESNYILEVLAREG